MRRGLLYAGVCTLSIAAAATLAFADRSPRIACHIEGKDREEFFALKEMPATISNALLAQLSKWSSGDASSLIAPRNADWQATDVIITKGLANRRFIKGGRSGTRWYVWYEKGGIGHSYHIALFDLPAPQQAARIVTHDVVAGPEALCPITQAILLRQSSPDPEINGHWEINDYW